MILKTAPAWQAELGRLITDPEALWSALQLDPALLPAARSAAALFPLRVTESYLGRIRRGDPDDALLRQILPIGAECVDRPGFSADPLEEAQASPAPGLIHKYAGRALLITTTQCAINCRYCFRRAFPYDDHRLNGAALEQALAQVAADPTINEIILSGGDPLAAGDRALAQLVDRLAGIGHLRRLRVHTRLPIVLPSRVTPELLTALAGTRLQAVVVVHANHPQELDAEVCAGLRQLAAGGLTCLNQSVLLRGINDSAEVLAALSEALFSCGTLPYYLHLLDRVSGAGHFEVPAAEAQRIYRDLAARLPGFLLPRLARELPGAAAKLHYGWHQSS